MVLSRPDQIVDGRILQRLDEMFAQQHSANNRHGLRESGVASDAWQCACLAIRASWPSLVSLAAFWQFLPPNHPMPQLPPLPSAPPRANTHGTFKNLIIASPSSCSAIVTIRMVSKGKEWDYACACACTCAYACPYETDATDASTQCQKADQCHTYASVDGTGLFEVEKCASEAHSSDVHLNPNR
jgi:hypothetical protein